MKKSSGCIGALFGIPAVWIVGWLLLFFVTDIGCRTSDEVRTDFSGTYRCPSRNDSSYALNPFFDHRNIAPESDIVIRQEAETILSVTQQLQDGHTETKDVDLLDSQFYWREGTLSWFRSVPQGDPIFPGVGFQTRWGTLSKDAEWDIHLSTRAREKALILYLIPLWETFNHHDIVLKEMDYSEDVTFDRSDAQ